CSYESNFGIFTIIGDTVHPTPAPAQTPKHPTEQRTFKLTSTTPKLFKTTTPADPGDHTEIIHKMDSLASKIAESTNNTTHEEWKHLLVNVTDEIHKSTQDDFIRNVSRPFAHHFVNTSLNSINQLIEAPHVWANLTPSGIQ